MSSGLEDFSIFDLFRMEAEEQILVLQEKLLLLETGTATDAGLEALMRAAHSLKGAARIVGLDTVVTLTHAMEERFVAAQAGSMLSSDEVTQMLSAVDWLAKLQALPEPEIAAWLQSNQAAITTLAASLNAPAEGAAASPAPSPQHVVGVPEPLAVATAAATAPPDAAPGTFRERERRQGRDGDRAVRINAERFDQILSLASETLVTARQLAGFADIMERHRRLRARAAHILTEETSTPREREAAQREIDKQAAILSDLLNDLDQVARANESTAARLHRTVLAGRLRPFSEGMGGVARLVRDTARELGKSVKLEVLGERTRVDRDILDKLEAPLMHLMSNAIDHGIESPDVRVTNGKPPEAQLRLHARHENGRLVVTVRDDGRGIEREQLRAAIVRKNLVNSHTAAGLSDAELLEFLFLPGFSTRQDVSTISGRGVGLNVVQSMVQEAGGAVTVTSDPGAGTVFRLTLPVTRSVMKVITVQAEGERYAIPLVRIDRVAQSLAREDSDVGGLVVDVDQHALKLVSLATLLGLADRPPAPGPVSYVVCQGVAFAVDRLVDETELPVRRLDDRLGKIPGVSAASLDETGAPLLILDMEDLLQSARGLPNTSARADAHEMLAPHILVVDDSHTVREMERRILVKAGYRVTAAQNGLEAWNLLRLNEYDLLVSDVDMPQMNGIELVTKVRSNPRLERLPVIILSYKSRDEDRRRGLDAGADFYLTKADFENDSFHQAVVDLIGEPDATVDEAHA